MNYFEQYFEILGSGLKSVNDITKFTENSDVIGQYAENVLYDFLIKFIDPLKISSGSIISPEQFSKTKNLPQIDAILWDANPLPPIFSIKDFSLVPRNSVFGVMEIKKTDYDKGIEDIINRFKEKDRLLPNFAAPNFLGVICVNKYWSPNGKNPFTRMRKELGENCVCLLNYYKTKTLTINYEDLRKLVNFVGRVKKLNKDSGKEYNLSDSIFK